jgi:hypothetical protein
MRGCYTPTTEAEPFYQALKLRKVDKAQVRVPGDSQDISEYRDGAEAPKKDR